MRQLQDRYLMTLGLEGLKRISSDKLNVRCKLCGDSSHNKSKKRGYFLWNRRYNTYVYFCHKCGASTNFKGFLKEINPLMYDLYVEEEKKISLQNYLSLKQETTSYVPKNSSEVTLDLLPSNCVKCKDDEKCYTYLQKRKIPRTFINKWYYHDDFGMIVPFEYTEDLIYGWQGRKLETKEFFTDLPEDNPKIWNYYQVKKEETCFVLESIIDATMMYHINYQSIAALGSDINPEYLEEFEDLVFIFDNDTVGKLKCIKYSKLFPKARFLVWDKRIKYKDLNEIIVNNISLEKFKKFIDTSLKTAYEVSILSKLNLL